MTIRIYLARHGQDQDNANGILNGHRDQPLTPLGEEQARTVASKIQQHKLHFDAVFSSPLQRSKRTAEILANGQGVETLDGLIERDFGIMTGKPTKDIPTLCKDVLQTDTICYFLSPQSAETFPDLIQRANELLADLQEKHAAGSILLVTHGDFGKMLYAAFYKLDWQDVLRQFHFGNSEILLLSSKSSPESAHIFHVEQYNH